MLPIRISVEGFMSYRDRTTFDFEGARLWMLSGANGAGKSTVFDALRWVLFGVHRAGKQKPEQLIHHEAAKLLVEVELELGDEIYKLKRTLGREGARPTWDVARRVGNAWESVAGTSFSNEYNRWVESHIGLTDEAFCASVYLSQGRADAILNADAEARYELLSQLVDLEIYELWHARAEERRSEARAQMADARKRWETAAAPAPEAIVALRERQTELEHDLSGLETRVRELEGARADASRWEEWNQQLESLAAQAENIGEVLQHEEAIERDFARLRMLKSQWGVVDGLWEAWNRHNALEVQIADLKPQLERAQAELRAVQEHNAQAQAEVLTAQSAANEANMLWSNKVSEFAELAAQRSVIDFRARLLAQRAEQTQLYAAFEEDVETRFETAQRELEGARETARVYPLWQRFDAARRAFASAQEQHGEWTKRQQQALEHQNLRQTEKAEARSALEQAAGEVGQAKEEMAKVEERERTLNLRRADFAQVEGESRCHFCGQELSEEHRTAEMERLEAEGQIIAQEKASAQFALRQAQERFETARNSEELAQKALDEATAEVTEATQEARRQSDNTIREHAAAREAWNEIGASALVEWGYEVGTLEMRDLSGVAHPNAADLEQMGAVAKNVAVLEKEVKRWQKRTQERALIEAELARLNGELGPLLDQWTDAKVEEWHTHAARIEEERAKAQLQRDKSQTTLEKAQTEARQAAQDERAAYAKADDLAQQIGPVEGQFMAATDALKTALSAFDEALGRQDELPLTSQQIEDLRDQWAREMSALKSANTQARHAALLEARSQLAEIERSQAFYRAQIESLSLLARRPCAQVEAEWSEAKARQAQTMTEREEVGDTLRRLEREDRERGVLEKQLQERTLEHERWEELARLLGPHQLQRHLLREAERAIVREANAILESISGGTLRLELLPDSDESSGNRRPKVLDVVCYHLTGSDEPQAILPAFLSGSQRFRVAVALALGIGRTAARGSGNGRAARVETILIDEGFGALDKTGRDEMKDELRELGRELGRVILVSHQDDFANAFPNRFNITLENGVSRVQKVVE